MAATSVASSSGDSGWSSRFGSAWGQFTLRQLFLWTAFVAVACVALRNATPTWASSLLGAALVLLAASLLLATFRDGRSRAFWIGFATAGWLYVTLLAYSTGIDTNNRPWNNPFRPDALITTQLSHWLYSWMCQRVAPPANSLGMMAGFGGMSGGMGMPMGSSMDSAGMGGPGAMYGGYDASGAGGTDSGYGAASGGMPGMGMMGPGATGPGGMGPMAPTPFIPDQHNFTNVAHALWTIVLAACGGALASWLYTTRPKTSNAASDAAAVAGSVQ